MIRSIMHDPIFLAQPSAEATKDDAQIITDLMDTLAAHQQGCVGMAANMIGEKKRIIAIYNGPMILPMVNPVILEKHGEYEAEEGCLSLTGTRKAKRYQSIKVAYQDRLFRLKTATFSGFPAQIIQHEIDHCNGVLI